MASKCSLGKSLKLAAVLNKLRIAVSSNTNNTSTNNENSDCKVKTENQVSVVTINESTCIADEEILITPLTPSLESNDNELKTEPSALEAEPIPPDDFGSEELKSTGHTKFHFDDEELEIFSSSDNVIDTQCNTLNATELCENKKEQLTETNILSETLNQTCDKIADGENGEKDKIAITSEKVADGKLDDESDMNNNEKLGQKKKSSRRKQQKTHKVIKQVDVTLDDSLLNSPLRKSSTDNYLDQQPSNESLNIKLLPIVDDNVDNIADNNSNNISPSSSSSLVNVEDAKITQEDFEDEFILPEGTVFVQPESVDASPVMFNIETSRPKRVFKGGNLDSAILHCTACNKQIGVDGSMDYHRHPVLKVLICRKCYYWYTSAEVDQDSEGTDEQCRWCRQGGDLICCDFCHNSFCKGCIRRNLGRKELNSILDSDECSKWKCYVCNPKPLLSLIEHCSAVMEALTKLEKKQQELELKRTKRYHIKSSTVASSTGNTSITLPSANSVAMVCNGSVSGVADKSQTRLGSSRVAVNNSTSAATAATTTSSNSSRLSAGSNGYFGIMPNSTLQVRLSKPPQQSVNAHILHQQQQQHKSLQSQCQSNNQTGCNSNNNSSSNNNASAKFILTSPTSPPAKTFPFKNISYTSQLSMVEKLLSVTSSMQMFLLSLNEGLQKNKPGIRHNPTCTTATATTTTTTTTTAGQSSGNKSALDISSINSSSNISKQNLNESVSSYPSSNNNNDNSSTIASPSNNNTSSSSTDSPLSPGAFIAKRRLIASKLWQAQQVFEKSYYNIAEMNTYSSSKIASAPCTASLKIVNNSTNLNASACTSGVNKQALSSGSSNINSSSLANQPKLIISPKSYISLNNSCNNTISNSSSGSIQPSYISNNYVKTVHSLLNKNYNATNINNPNNNTSASTKHLSNNSGLQQQSVRPKVIVLNTPDSSKTNNISINRINNRMTAHTRQNSSKSIISKSAHSTSSSGASILNKSTSGAASSDQDQLNSSSVSRASIAVSTATTSASKSSNNSFYMVNRQFVKILPKIAPGSSTQVTSKAVSSASTNVTICGSNVSVGTSSNTSGIKSSSGSCTSDSSSFVVVELLDKSPSASKNNSRSLRNNADKLSGEGNSATISTTTANSISITAIVATTATTTTTVTRSSTTSKMANNVATAAAATTTNTITATNFSLDNSSNVCVMKNYENDDVEEDILIISDSEDDDGDADNDGDVATTASMRSAGNVRRNNDDNDVVNLSSSRDGRGNSSKTISNSASASAAVGIDNSVSDSNIKCMQTRRRKLSNCASGNKIDGDGDDEVNVTSGRKNIPHKITSNDDDDICNDNANNDVSCDNDSLAPSTKKSKKEPSKKSARNRVDRNYGSESVNKLLTSGNIVGCGQNVKEVDANITEADTGDTNTTVRRKKTEDVKEDEMVTGDGSSFKDGRGDDVAGVKIEVTTYNGEDVEGEGGGEPAKKKRKLSKSKDFEKLSASGSITLNGNSGKPSSSSSSSSSRISTRRQTRLSKEQQRLCQQERQQSDEFTPHISASSQSCSASSSSSSLSPPKTVLSPTPPSSTSSTTLPLASSSASSIESNRGKRKLSVAAEQQSKIFPRRNSLPVAKQNNQRVNKNVCNDKSTGNGDSGANKDEDGEMHGQKVSKKKYNKPSRRK